MTQEELCLLMGQCGLLQINKLQFNGTQFVLTDEFIEGDAANLWQFAQQVSRIERQIVADWMMSHGYATGHGETTQDLLSELEWQIEERTAIAIDKAMSGGQS